MRQITIITSTAIQTASGDCAISALVAAIMAFTAATVALTAAFAATTAVRAATRAAWAAALAARAVAWAVLWDSFGRLLAGLDTGLGSLFPAVLIDLLVVFIVPLAVEEACLMVLRLLSTVLMPFLPRSRVLMALRS